MTQVTELLNEIIGDRYDGPYEGEDYWIDDDGTVQVPDNNVILAAKIMRKANNSGQFDLKLVKIGQKGDSILLAFDNLISTQAVYSTKIGYLKGVIAEIKTDGKKYCIYLDGKRSTRMFNKLSSAKTFIKKLDKDLQATGETVASYEESDD